MSMEFRDFFTNLTTEQRARFAADAGTTDDYIRHHLLGGRRLPRRALLHGMAGAAAKFGVTFKPEQILASLMQADQGRAA